MKCFSLFNRFFLLSDYMQTLLILLLNNMLRQIYIYCKIDVAHLYDGLHLRKSREVVS